MNELNLENAPEILREVQHKIQDEQIDATIFDRLQTLVLTNMCDSFGRFRLTAEYKNYKEKYDAKEALLKEQFDKENTPSRNSTHS
jgi:uncharacterized protein YifN (PemK superfamily)